MFQTVTHCNNMIVNSKILTFVVLFGHLKCGITQSQREKNNEEVYICDGKSEELQCQREMDVIYVDNAFYGRTEGAICTNGTSLPFDSCFSQTSFRDIWETCSGKKNCYVTADSRLFGNPCPGVSGYVHISYRCANPGSSIIGECDTGSWGSWINTDSPRGFGDFEYIFNHRRRKEIACQEPIGIEVRLKDGRSYMNGGDVIRVGYLYGATCANSQQDDLSCEDYKVRYCCQSGKNPFCVTPVPPTNGFLTLARRRNLPPGSVIRFSCRDGYRLVGEAESVCLTSSDWSNSSPTCIKTVIDMAFCESSSFPHFRTFDGKYYKFGGVCTYLMSRTRRRNRPDSFHIEIQSQRNERSEKWIRILTIRIFGHEVKLGEKGQVMVDGKVVRLPHSMKNKFEIVASGRYVRFTTAYKLFILHDGNEYISVGLPRNYNRELEGLCGNFNGDVIDDFYVQRGRVRLSDPETFGNHYRMPTDEPCNEKVNWVNDQYKSCGSEVAVIQHRKSCSVINDPTGVFKNCATIDKDYYFQMCLYDSCTQNGSKEALVNAASAAAVLCNYKGQITTDWRSALNAMPCEGNSSYKVCGSECPRTCLNRSPTEDECLGICVEGCECDDGYVLSDWQCVKTPQCGCLFEGKYYKSGESFLSWSCTRKCDCKTGVMACRRDWCPENTKCGTDSKAYGACRAWGAPQYVTFDGNGFYDFNGRCAYVMSETYNVPTSDPRWFSVIVKSGHKSGNSGYFQFQSVEILLQRKSLRVILFNNGTIMMNGNLILEADTKDIMISRYANSINVSNKLGLSVSFTGQVLHIKLSPDFRGKIRGVCGDFNGNANDDLFIPTVFSNNRADRPFQLGSCQSESSSQLKCQVDTLSKWRSIEYCGALTNQAGYFKDCHRSVDPGMFFEKCLFDVCVSKGDKKVLSEAFLEYVEACRVEGHDFCDWRVALGATQLKCPPHSTYQGCASSCRDTCFKSAELLQCEGTKTEACVCDRGFVIEGDKCIRLKDCGCSKDGIHVAKGAIWFDKQTDLECRCRENGVFPCSCKEGFRWTNRGCRDINECRRDICGPDATCINTEGSYYCECHRGKILQGNHCRDPVCSRPTPPRHASITPDLDTYPINTVISYSCERGYELVGFPQRVCFEEEAWYNDEPFCEKIVICDPPKFINNGEYSPEKNIYNVDEEIKYDCFDGIKIRGSSSRVCLHTGDWSGEDPECIAECLKPELPENVLTVTPLKDIYLERDVIEYSCAQGYDLTTSSFRACLKNGSWAGPTPVCAASSCRAPFVRDNGFFEPNRSGSWSMGSRVTYYCNSGYASPLWKVIQSECLLGGHWSIRPPPCLDIDECRTSLCRERHKTTGKCVSITSMHKCHHDAVCTNYRGGYSCLCKAGFTGDGFENCTFSVPCLVPRDFENGEIKSVAPDAILEDQTVTYVCHQGYTLEGGAENTCMANGRWRNRISQCIDVDECESHPCAEHATCTNTEGSYACFCRAGYTGDGFEDCRVCELNECDCFEDGLSYKDGELFWTAGCRKRCTCESGSIFCTEFGCEENQRCVVDADMKHHCEGRRKCELRPRIVQVPGCFDARNRTQTYNAGKCTSATCSEASNTCCGISLEESHALQCRKIDGTPYSLQLHRITQCSCINCLDSRTTLYVRAYGIDEKGKEKPVEFASIYKEGKLITHSSVNGTFSMHFDSPRQSFFVLIQDNQEEFLTVERKVDFRMNGGTMFLDMQIPTLSRFTEDSDSDEALQMRLENVHISIAPYSFRKMRGDLYLGKVSRKSKNLIEKDRKLGTMLGSMSSSGNVLLLFFDVFYVMFRGSRHEVLKVDQADISLSLNTPNDEAQRDMFLWRWDFDSHQWDKENKFETALGSGNFTVSYDLSDADNHIAIAQPVKDLCFIKVRGYETDEYKYSEQIENLIIKGVYAKEGTWYTTVQGITTDAHGKCIPLPCHGEHYKAKFTAIINGNITLNPDNEIDLEIQQSFQIVTDATDNSIGATIHPTRMQHEELLHRSFASCNSSGSFSKHLRFFLKSKYLSELNVIPIDENQILTTWYNSPKVWWSNPRSFTACYVKIGIKGFPVYVKASSFAGRRLDILGNLYGTRRDKSLGKANSSAVCLEVKCSGVFLDGVQDVTMVEIDAEGDCNRTFVNPELEKLYNPNYLKQNSANKYRMLYPLAKSGNAYGLYRHTSRDLYISKYTALRECYAGNGRFSNTIIPDEGLTAVFNCL